MPRHRIIMACLALAPPRRPGRRRPGRLPGAIHHPLPLHLQQQPRRLGQGTLVARNGVLFGAGEEGGATGEGTVFMFDLASKAETTLFSFRGGKVQGELPHGPLSLVGNGALLSVAYRLQLHQRV